MLSEAERETQADYDASAEQKYDAAVDWLFRSFYENEDDVRERMIDLLHLTPDARVLEIGSGTGRDSFRIARKLGERGEFFVQDLSEQMVFKTRSGWRPRARSSDSLRASITLCQRHAFSLSPTASLTLSSTSVVSTTSASLRRRSGR